MHASGFRAIPCIYIYVLFSMGQFESIAGIFNIFSVSPLNRNFKLSSIHIHSPKIEVFFAYQVIEASNNFRPNAILGSEPLVSGYMALRLDSVCFNLIKTNVGDICAYIFLFSVTSIHVYRYHSHLFPYHSCMCKVPIYYSIIIFLRSYPPLWWNDAATSQRFYSPYNIYHYIAYRRIYL